MEIRPQPSVQQAGPARSGGNAGAVASPGTSTGLPGVHESAESSEASAPGDAIHVGSTPLVGVIDAARAALVEAVGCNMLTVPAAMVSTLAPAGLTAAASAAAHDAHVQLLENLKGKGMPVFQRHRVLFTWYREASSEKAVRAVEKREAPRAEPAKSPMFLNVDAEVGIPIAARSDLRILDALEGSGSLDGVPDPALAQALRDLSRSGCRFQATFETIAYDVNKQADRYSGADHNVGSYGAYKVLGEGLSGVSGVRVLTTETFNVEDRESLLALNFFTNKGSSTGLAEPEQASAMRDLSQRFRFQSGHSKPTLMRLYLQSLKTPADKRTFHIDPGAGFAVPVTRSELLDTQTLITRLDGLKARFDRMARADSKQASAALNQMVKAGQVDDAHERAFHIVAGLPAGDSSKASEIYQAVSEATLAGETVEQAATCYADLCRAQFPEKRGLAAATFVALRTDFDRLTGPIGNEEKAERFVTLVHYFGDTKAATEAWADTGAGALSKEKFDEGLEFIKSLEGTGSNPQGRALTQWKQIAGVVQPGDDVAEAVQVMREVALHVRDQWRWDGEVEKAFRFAWRELPGHGPTDMSVPDRRQHYMTLLQEFKDVKSASMGWELLSAAPTTPDLLQSEETLLRVYRAAPGEAFETFSELAELTRERGGFHGPEAARWLRLIEACGSWKGAREADQLLQGLPAGLSQDDRVGMFCDLKMSNAHKSDNVTADLAFLARYVPAAEQMPSASARYCSLLRATRGNTGEARESLALMDAHLSHDGPSGIPAADRQALHTRLLSQGLDCASAHVFLTRLERVSADQGTAATGVDALEQMCAGFHKVSSRPLDSATTIWKALESKGSNPAKLAEVASVVGRILPILTARTDAMQWLTENIFSLPDLDAIREAGRDMLRIAEVNPELATSFALLRPFAEQQGWDTVLSAIKDYDGMVTALPGLLKALNENPELASDGASTMLRRLGCLTRGGNAKAALWSYGVISDWVQGVSWAGEPQARIDRWCKALAGMEARDSLPATLHSLSVPFGRETLGQREEILLAFVQDARDVRDPLAHGLELLRATLEHTGPGDELLDCRRRLGTLVGLELSNADAVRVLVSLQEDRVQGGRFAGQSLDTLVEEFSTIYGETAATWTQRDNVQRVFGGQGRQHHGKGNPVDEALDRMHGSNGLVQEVVKSAEDEIVLGGVRIKKKA